MPPIAECPEVDSLVITEQAVHLIVRIAGDWEGAREQTVAEVERRTQAATAYAASDAFAARFGTRIGIVRVQTDFAPPSIVGELLTERTIELENLSSPPPTAGNTCSFCGREHLSPEQERMTDTGWACPSCFYAWNIRQNPAQFKKPFRLRLPSWLIYTLIAIFTVLFLLGAYHELRQLNKMNRIIRQHLPSE